MQSKRKNVPSVLFCVACGHTHGIGHLKRCLSLIRESRGGYAPILCVLKGGSRGRHLEEAGTLGADIVETPEDASRVDLVVSDMRDTSAREMDGLLRLAPVVSLDDFGAGMERAHVTIVSFPSPKSTRANFMGAPYMVLGSDTSRSRTPEAEPSQGKDRVVISFGGSDPHNLSDKVTEVLNGMGVCPLVITGPLYRGNIRGRCTIIRNPRNPVDLFRESDLLITAFGITLYEAMLAGTPVALFNHSRYHWQLASETPAINLGYYPRTDSEELASRIGDILHDPALLRRSAERNATLIDGEGARRVNDILFSAARGQRSHCLFHHDRWAALKRNNRHSIFRCRRCGDLFLFSLEQERVDRYGSSYFLSEYQEQYGRSYRQDRPVIRSLAENRIHRIERLTRRRGKLLDVGCALGFFVELAVERGWNAQGVELSEYAASWARERLGLQVRTGSFLDVDFDGARFDAITLFYVAEHFPRVEKVLERVHALLFEGGVLVLALPNRGGISFRLNRPEYLDRHPGDHYFDTNPGNLKRMLKHRGFRCAVLRSTGIHPERFYRRIGIRSREGPVRAVLYGVYTLLARILRLGDTFEYYGIKQ